MPYRFRRFIYMSVLIYLLAKLRPYFRHAAFNCSLSRKACAKKCLPFYHASIHYWLLIIHKHPFQSYLHLHSLPHPLQLNIHLLITGFFLKLQPFHISQHLSKLNRHILTQISRLLQSFRSTHCCPFFNYTTFSQISPWQISFV